MDVTVSSIGDAQTIQGGVLIQTPLLGADDVVYAVAQGSVAIGGFLAAAKAAAFHRQKNHPPSAPIKAEEARLEREIEAQIVTISKSNFFSSIPTTPPRPARQKP